MLHRRGPSLNVALATLDQAATARFAAAHGLSDDLIASHPELISAVTAGVRRANEQLSAVERVRRILILANDWAPGGDEVTPSMKLRRAVITKVYNLEIDALYRKAIGHHC